MSVAPSITWLLVRTSPSDVITMPLPLATPEPTVPVMLTMPRSTAAATDSTFDDEFVDLDEPDDPDDPDDPGDADDPGGPPNAPPAGGDAVEFPDGALSRPRT